MNIPFRLIRAVSCAALLIGLTPPAYAIGSDTSLLALAFTNIIAED